LIHVDSINPFAVVQYFCKLVLLYAFVHPQNKIRFPAIRDRLSHLVGAFSTARKIIRLGHAVEPYADLHPILAATSFRSLLTGGPRRVIPTDNILSTLNNTLSVLNDCSDDVVCLSKIGVLDKTTGKRFEPISNWLWLTCIALDLYAGMQEVSRIVSKIKVMEKELIKLKTATATTFTASNPGTPVPSSPSESRSVTPVPGKPMSGTEKPISNGSLQIPASSGPLRTPMSPKVNSAAPLTANADDGLLRRSAELQAMYDKLWLQKVSIYKLLADLGFCTYDVIEAQFSDRFQAFCGFTAGCLGLYKLWRKAQ
jgi:hypothetical protein